MKLSARNCLKGKITSIIEGMVVAKVNVEIGTGETIVSIITMDSIKGLGLKVGDEVSAIIKSTEVMIGIPD